MKRIAKYKQTTKRNPLTGEFGGGVAPVFEDDGLPTETDDMDADDWNEQMDRGIPRYRSMNPDNFRQ